MKLLIYDPLYAGHHLDWVRLLIEASIPIADRITFATTQAAGASEEFREHLSRLGGAFELDDKVQPIERGVERLEGFRIARRAWLELASAISRHKPDHVFVPFGDNLLRASLGITPRGLRLGVPPEAIDLIVLTGAFAYHRDLPWKRRLRSYVELLGLSRLPVGRLLFIDAIAHGWLAEHFPSLGGRCLPCPDPVSPVATTGKTEARLSLGLPTDGRLISCAGVLDARKGIDEFVRTFATANLGTTDRLLLAGRAKPEVHKAVAETIPRIGVSRVHQCDRILSAEELNSAIRAADLVAVPYHFPAHIGSASILIRAAAVGRPVLAAEMGWPGHITRRHKLGWIYPQDAALRPNAICEALDASTSYAASAEAQQFADFHSVRRFAEILTEPLRRQSESGAGVDRMIATAR